MDVPARYQQTVPSRCLRCGQVLFSTAPGIEYVGGNDQVDEQNASAKGMVMATERVEQNGAVAGVVLAAGRSSRMGHPKQVALVDGVPMVVRAVMVAWQSGIEEVWVVTGAHAAAVEAALLPLLQRNGPHLHLQQNDAWATGQASTVRAAIQALPATVAAALFLPVDQPFVPPALLQALIECWQGGARLAAPAIDGAVRGAPAIFDRSLWPELLQLDGDVGARPLLQRHRAALVTVPAEAAWLRDIDTPADLANL